MGNFSQIYLHFVWGTKQRMPLITKDIQEDLYSIIADKCGELGCHLIAIGGVADHVHLLISIPTKLSAAQLMKHVKGNSSYLINHAFQREQVFQWQGNYGVFSVSRSHLDTIANYIKNQEAHHRDNTIISVLEMMEDLDG
jgi:REP element-mobilizing transposase RayT